MLSLCVMHKKVLTMKRSVRCPECLMSLLASRGGLELARYHNYIDDQNVKKELHKRAQLHHVRYHCLL